MIHKCSISGCTRTAWDDLYCNWHRLEFYLKENNDKELNKSTKTNKTKTKTKEKIK
jgi:hypothetical protein